MYTVSTLRESGSGVLQESIGFLFLIQKNFYYLQLYKVRDDDDAIPGNITAELNDHIHLYQTRASY